jgi:hypothetical protein
MHPRLRFLAALASVALPLSSAPSALGATTPVGGSAGTPTANICSLSLECTYVNYAHGKPTDVVPRSGALTDWSVNAGSVGGQVELRILRPVGHGRFRVVRTSSPQTIVNPGENTFAASLNVRAGDVLGLTNSTSGIYMEAASQGTCVRYFDAAISDGSSAKPGRVAPQLHLLLSADVQR